VDLQPLLVRAPGSGSPGYEGCSNGINPLDSPLDFGNGDSCSLTSGGQDCPSELSPGSGSLKFIEPDVASISKLLNFDEGEDSFDGKCNDDNDSNENVDGGGDINEPDDAKLITNIVGEVVTHSVKKDTKNNLIQVSFIQGINNLTLEEVGHIRSVHAKADIEDLADDNSIKKDVIAGNICFQCKKTKFGFFSKSIKCPLCSQTVCAKCSTKLSVTPSVLLPRDVQISYDDTNCSGPRQRSSTSTWSSKTGTARRPSCCMSRTQQGAVLSVCIDCRNMVVQFIKSGLGVC